MPIVCAIRGDPEEKFRRVQAGAAQYGIQLIGDSTSAQFSGQISGSYFRNGNIVTVTITRNDTGLPMFMVNSMIRKFLME